MDPCPFVRILVGNLTLKFPKASKPSFSGVHPSTSPCFCKIKLSNFPTHFATVPLVPHENQTPDSQYSHSLAACFNLNKSQIDKLLQKRKSPCLKIEIYTGRRETTTCEISNKSKLIGRVMVPLNLGLAQSCSRACVFHNGWVSMGDNKKGSSAELYLSVRSEPDPRFVFQFDGEPECSPQVFQVQGSVRQPVFSCKFGFRSERGRDLRSSSSMSHSTSTSTSWLPKIGSNKDQPAKERKGWSITIHDLSGSPVAMASMVTPFVPSPGSTRVSRSNPGAWLILRPEDGTWKPWGRLEAWRERGSSESIGYRFELLPATPAAATLASAAVSAKKGGKFTIDMTSSASPVNSPHGSFDFGSNSGSRSGSGDFGYLTQFCYKGFVMSSTVEGLGRSSKPEVEVGVQHVTCTEDAAAFVALAAAMDLSMDACMLFSQNLRKELRQQS